MVSDSAALADTVGFELLGHGLGNDVKAALQAALLGGAVFPHGDQAPVIFRHALASSIRSIESHPRGRLFQEFLLKGPFDDGGEVPNASVVKYLSDADCANAISFVYSYMINQFKGAIAELLATRPCLELLKRFQKESKLPQGAKLYFGDAVVNYRARRKGILKGADLNVLIANCIADTSTSVTMAGVAEVKSYIKSQQLLREQLNRQLQRAKRGLQVGGVDYPGGAISMGYGKDRRIARIAVVPSGWKLPRTFRFEETQHGCELHVDAREPPLTNDKITQVADDEWRITLKWSAEALAEAAYNMTLWYMGKVGEIVYSKSLPKEWEHMTPTVAGQNAVKMMLYYAICRSRSVDEEQRAIALYNSYCYGYAIGMNFKNAMGRREMLWPQDLNEILSVGKTTKGCKLR